jgi:DNA processing protein
MDGVAAENGRKLTPDEVLHWLALVLVPGLGARTSGRLIEQMRTPEAVFRASRSELEAAGLSGSLAQTIASGCSFEEAASQQEKLAASNAEIVPITDSRYPTRLREIFDPPVLLFTRGRTELLDSLMIGVVGTRRPSAYGTAATERLAGDLAALGLTIVSGMARGIDTAAHRAAFERGGNTLAVFGSGVDMIYPAENRKLADRIAREGLIVSEYPMSSPPYPQNFPVRNRIISGMSTGVLVVEGAQYSGSAITARLALDQGREVFAVPGNITSKMSWGPNILIRQGATLVQEATDVLGELSPGDRRRLANLLNNKDNNDAATSSDIQASLPLGPWADTGKEILKALRVDAPIHLDQLLERLEGRSSSEIIAALFELEVAGLVRQLPGRQFLRVWAS